MLKDKLLIFKEDSIDIKNTIYILILIMVLSGIFGFIYETFFYRIDLGYFVKRGSTFGPWIPIYAFGGLFITMLTYKFKKNPILVLLISCATSGTLEYATGWFFYEIMGTRLWDYNTEIWNFGNINGYICLRSVLFFGVAGLILIYGLIPILKKIVSRIPEKPFGIISTSLGLLFMLDIILHAIIV